VEPLGPKLEAYIANIPRDETNTVQFLVGLNARLQGDVKYLIRMEPGVHTPEETLELMCGSCRDSA
jgi:transglutaminase-like putative cysteine protease